jgi:hypothetical protein
MLVALARKMGRSQTVIDDLQADYWKTKQESDTQRKMQRESLQSFGKST